MKANKILEENDIEFKLVEQENPVETCEEAAEERGVETSQIVKSLIVERGGEKYHVCVPGDRKLSEKKFGEHRLVDPEESKEITGFKSGTVHPLSTDLKHFIDERVFENEEISFTIGTDTEGVILDAEDFGDALEEKGIDYEVTDLVVTEEEDVEQLKDKGVGEENAKFLADKGYRRIFQRLEDDHEIGELIDGIRKLHREEIEFGSEEVEKIIERAESENHMHKLAETLAEEGELPEQQEGFDLETVVEEAVDENPKAVEDFNDGKDSAVNYLIGHIMQKTKGRADAGEARQLLLSELE